MDNNDNKIFNKLEVVAPTDNFQYSHEFKDGFCIIKINNQVYKYREHNSRVYSNDEFVNMLNASLGERDYYLIPKYNIKPYEKDLFKDLEFVDRIKTILNYTKSQQKKNVINKILNECMIIDVEPVSADNAKNMTLSNVKNIGRFHLDRDKLKDAYIDAINYAYHKYINRFENKQYSQEEMKELELLSKIK